MVKLRLPALSLLAAVAFTILMSAAPAFAQKKEKDPNSLYHRLGGYDVIASIVDDWLVALHGDQKFQRFGGGRSGDSLARTRQLVVDQVCWLADGPCAYIGREMKPSHKGLGITQEEWEAAQAHFAAALDKNKVKEKEKNELLAAIEKLRPDIVEAKKSAEK